MPPLPQLRKAIVLRGFPGRGDAKALVGASKFPLSAGRGDSRELRRWREYRESTEMRYIICADKLLFFASRERHEPMRVYSGILRLLHTKLQTC
jgi:hypothetical protein